MNRYVADTMAIVLFLEKRKLPISIKSIFNEGNNTTIIHISAVSLMEIGYLSEKSRIDIDIASVLQLIQQNGNFKIHPLNAETITKAFEIKTIPELHD